MRTGYAADILDFSVRFDTEEACFEYLRTIRWPDGFICPACSHRGGWWLKAYSRFECQACHRQLSPLSGTVMHRSHLPLRLWFWAAYFVSTHTPGISAVQLQRQLGSRRWIAPGTCSTDCDEEWYGKTVNLKTAVGSRKSAQPLVNVKIDSYPKGDHAILTFPMHINGLHSFFALNCRF